jgi:hypothetical protein
MLPYIGWLMRCGMAERHYLVFRDRRGIRNIDVYDADEQEHALGDYAAMENRCESANRSRGGFEPYDCCLFGADSLLTLCHTHASWFCPETLPDTIDALLGSEALERIEGQR